MPRKAPPLSARAVAARPRPRIRNSRSGSSGLAVRDSTSTNVPSSASPATNRMSTWAEPQPAASVRMTAPTSVSSPAVPSTAPATSKPCGLSLRLADDHRRHHQRERGHRDVDEEDPPPPERVDQDAAGDDPKRAADAGQRAPHAERDVARAPRREG